MKLNCSMVNISQRKMGGISCLVFPMNKVVVVLVLDTVRGGKGYCCFTELISIFCKLSAPNIAFLAF